MVECTGMRTGHLYPRTTPAILVPASLNGGCGEIGLHRIRSVDAAPGRPEGAMSETAPGNGGGAESLVTADYDGLAASALSALSYSTYDTTSNGSQFPFIQLMISYTGGTPEFPDSNVDDIWFFEPAYQNGSGSANCPGSQNAIAAGQWQSWNAAGGCWWDNQGVGNPGDGVVTLGTLLAAEPDATVVEDWNGNGGLQLTVGYASSDDNFNGNVDAVTVNSTTYDFEPAPEPSTWAMSLLAFGGLAQQLARLHVGLAR